MQLKFVPYRLIQTKNEIIKQHQKVIDQKFVYTEEERKVIKKVIGWQYIQVAKNYLTLTRDEQIIVASYLPYNFDNLNMTNLFLVTTLAMDSVIAKALFTQWQYSYKNEECNHFIAKLLKNSSPFIDLVNSHNYSAKFLLRVMQSKSILRHFGKMIYDEKETADLCQNVLDYHKMKNTTMIYNDCIRYIYTFCDLNEYLNNKENLQNEVSTYDDNNKKEFLINFLEELPYDNLMQFPSLPDFCISVITGQLDSEKYSAFFDEYPKELEQKYRDWINSSTIVCYFGMDERSRFWKNYRFISIKKSNRHEMVIMECANYYITEFLGRAMGPMYIYEKQFYEENVSHWLLTHTTQELRSTMYHYENLAKRRFVHKQFWWQSEFKHYILQNEITETIT